MNLSANSPTGFTRVRFGGHSDQRFRRSLTDFAEANVSFFYAAILIFPPLAVLRAGRKGVAFSLGLGNIGSQRRPDPQRSPFRRESRGPSSSDVRIAIPPLSPIDMPRITPRRRCDAFRNGCHSVSER